MSLKSSTMVPPSLPSFAATFSSSSFGSIPADDNSLPPIQARASVSDFRRVKSPAVSNSSRQQSENTQVAGRKRTRIDVSGPDHDDQSDSDTSSPHVKEEPEQDMLDPTPPPSHQPANYDNSAAPPPSSVQPSPMKKRRVTVSGTPALDTDVRAPTDQSNSTPISPVVIGFTIQRDNPSAVDAVRSMLTVRQQQQALIEQRRGSVAGIGSPNVGAASVDPASTSNKPPAPGARTVRRSPNSGTGNRRHTNAPPSNASSNARPPSPTTAASAHPPPPPISAPVAAPPGPLPSHSLPPPPISFARRRATQLGGIGKKKPADIVISPREAHTKEQLALSIQSAPPIPQGGQPGRFPMTLPRLPPVMAPGNNNIQRLAGGKVPPTPTRFTTQRSTMSNAVHPIPSIAGRSPPNASVAIASTLVPPTPSSLHHPGYTGEKSAFLAPFEMFYDALNDSKQLKAWLGDQLHRSNTLMERLTQQQEKLNDMVDAIVDKKFGSMKTEIQSLRHRVDELEDALRAASRRPSIEGYNPTGKGKGKQPMRNGIPSGPMAPESYTFPPISNPDRERYRPEMERERERRVSSPGWNPDRDREHMNSQDPDRGSPIPYESRRLSLSASRLDPPRPAGVDGRSSFRLPSPQQSHREGPSASVGIPTLPPHPSPSGNHGNKRTRRPSISRQHSGPLRGGLPERSASSPPRREESSRDRKESDVSMDSRDS
ncbi:hypothetical protein Moror_13933 [Moniliophthora roreri MCA 2997]|uniref:Uncharacterized protein n=2 Tax=Moniliophthora roreri TaxID=221103 RepID=V2X783_MONRO|nr:hypothetical protein Moror_13933 [Moniliophthora roreri MCA 2997]KAI3607632.1 hypothetical protein WG66_004987 [Moniliophthora roreri]